MNLYLSIMQILAHAIMLQIICDGLMLVFFIANMAGGYFYLSLMFWFSVLILAALRMAVLTPLLSPRTPCELLPLPPDLSSPIFFMFSFSNKSGRFKLDVDWFNLYLTLKSGEDWGV